MTYKNYRVWYIPFRLYLNTGISIHTNCKLIVENKIGSEDIFRKSYIFFTLSLSSHLAILHRIMETNSHPSTEYIFFTLFCSSHLAILHRIMETDSHPSTGSNTSHMYKNGLLWFWPHQI